MSEDTEIVDATNKAVQLVKKNEIHRNRLLVLAIAFIFVIGLIAQTWYLNSIYDSTHSALNAVESLSQSVANQIKADNESNKEILCNIQAAGLSLSQGFAEWSKKFGVPIPPPPQGNQNVQCTNGVDPVFLGTDKADVIRGTGDPDWMNGEGGNDTLVAKGNGDTLIGDTGNDTLYGGRGEDWLYGGEGNDNLYASIDDGKVDHLNGGDGQDTCYINAGDKTKSCEKVITP